MSLWTDKPQRGDRLLKPTDVAHFFAVDPKTVSAWAASGKLGYVLTPSNQRLYPEYEIDRIVRGDPIPEDCTLRRGPLKDHLKNRESA